MKNKIDIKFIKILNKYYRLNLIIINFSRIKNIKLSDRKTILILLKIRRIINVLY